MIQVLRFFARASTALLELCKRRGIRFIDVLNTMAFFVLTESERVQLALGTGLQLGTGVEEPTDILVLEERSTPTVCIKMSGARVTIAVFHQS